MKKPNNKIINLCKTLSAKSDYKDHKLGCVIIKRNRIVSIGFNKCKTHPKSLSIYKTLHAEMDAIIGKTEDELKNSTLYVWRYKKTGEVGLAKPCSACMIMIKECGIKYIYYSDENELGYSIIRV